MKQYQASLLTQSTNYRNYLPQDPELKDSVAVLLDPVILFIDHIRNCLGFKMQFYKHAPLKFHKIRRYEFFCIDTDTTDTAMSSINICLVPILQDLVASILLVSVGTTFL